MTPLHEIENSLICLMLDTGCRARARALVEPRWFSNHEYREAFEAALAWTDPGLPLTSLGWSKSLAERTGKPWPVCRDLIVAALRYSGAPENLEAYAALMRENHERNLMLAGAEALLNRAMDQTCNPEDLASEASALGKLPRPRLSPDVELRSGAQWASEEAAAQVATGFGALDRMLGGGFLPGALYTLAGRTSMGKTALALDMVRAAALDQVPVSIISPEMTPAQIMKRLELKGRCDFERPPRAWFGAGSLDLKLVARLLERWTAMGLGLLVLDHLQRWTGEAKGNRHQELSAAVNGLRDLAGEYRVPILLLSQLSRAVEKRSGRKPMLADLRESGTIEETSDVVMLLYRLGYYDAKADQHPTELLVKKNRLGGRTGIIKLNWHPERACFSGVAWEGWETSPA